MTTPPYITTVFNPPLASDSGAAFDVKAFDTVAKYNPWGTSANTLADWMNQTGDEVLAAAIAGNLSSLDLSSLAGQFLKVKDDGTGIDASPLTSAENAIINGNFAVNQRGVSGTVTLAAGQYGHDRWKAGAAGCTYTFNTVENVTTVTISAGSLVQVIEGINVQSGDHTLAWDGTVQMSIDGGAAGASGVTASLTGGTNISVETSGAGTLSLVRLTTGSIAAPFIHRSYGDGLERCQRYYQVVHQRGNSAAGTYYSFFDRFHGNQLQFTPMRATPSVAFAIVSGSFRWVNPGVIPVSADTTANFSFFAHQGENEWGAIDFYQTRTAGGGAPVDGGAYRLEASIDFKLDAEL